MKQRNPKRRHEYVDPTPTTAAVKFQRPPTLAEQIARYMGQHQRWQAQQGFETPDEAEDIESPEEEHVESPHELVFDEQLNREMPRYEKMVLDAQRKTFDEQLEKKRRADLAARKAADEAERRLKEEKRSTKKVESPDGDED